MYNYNGNSAGYTKPNMTVNAHPQSRWWPVTMTKLYTNKCESTILGITSYQVMGFLHLSGKVLILSNLLVQLYGVSLKFLLPALSFYRHNQ